MKGFHKQLKQALKHVHDPEWLGTHSALAAPYFLSRVLQSGSVTAVVRGDILRQQVLNACDALWGDVPPRSRSEIETAMPEILQSPGNGRYHYLVLELRYFRRYFKPRRLSEIWDTFLGESRAEFYRDLDRATAELGVVLLRQLHPTFRLEKPVNPLWLVGRENVLQQSLEMLQAGKTVALSGVGGVGKTALGAAIAARWPAGAVFWFTIRPSLNDQLGSLVFSLATFFHKQGSSHLWQYLVANHGKIEDVNLVLGFARADLESLQTAGMFLCFDEIDLLRATDFDRRAPAYHQILAFLESLRGQVAMLLLGERVVFEVDLHHVLHGLNNQEVHSFLQQSTVLLSVEDAARLAADTHGNPRLLRLFAATFRLSEQTITEALDAFAQATTLQPLFDRLWRRLEREDRRFLQAISAFRSPAPLDAWSMSESALLRLQQHYLIQHDDQGGVALLPAWRELIYRDLSPELREQCHLDAAAIRLVRGEYTAVSHHYFQAGHYREAVRAWFPHSKQEIARGQAEAALMIFDQISLRRLNQKDARALALIRAELKQLVGDLQGGLTDLETQDWSLDSEWTVRARSLKGQFLYNLGFPEKAAATYAEGIALIDRLQIQLVQFHNLRSRVFIRHKQSAEAQRELMLAQYETDILLAMLQASQGDFVDAQHRYQEALALAEDVGYAEGIASAHRNLASLFARQAKLTESIAHAEKAIAYYKRMGNQFRMAMVQVNLPAAYVQAKQFDKAIATAHEILPLFERIRNPHFIGVTAVNLAEAYFETGDLEQAQQYAYLAIQQEDAHTIPYGLFTQARIWQVQGKPAKARGVLDQAQALVESGGDAYLFAYVKRLRGEILNSVGEQDEGQTLLQQAIQLFEELDMKQEAIETEQLLHAVQI